MRHVESLQKVYYCSLRDNRLMDDSAGVQPYRYVDSRDWSPAERAPGKAVKITALPKGHKVRQFRVEVSTHRTAWVVTNAPT